MREIAPVRYSGRAFAGMFGGRMPPAANGIRCGADTAEPVEKAHSKHPRWSKGGTVV